MSQTISVGVVGPSHWAYMASVMAEKLQKISEARRTTAKQIPAGVYRDAQEFYRLVLEAAGDGTPVNPPASINAYALAADALRTVCAKEISRDEIEQTLGRQKALLENLQNDIELSSDELKTLSSLRDCFLWLKHEGETDAYERGVGHELPVGFRTR
jgi:hypothetical protein